MIFFALKNKNGTKVKTVDTTKKLAQESGESFHYKEELVMESGLGMSFMSLMKYKSLPVKFDGDEGLCLVNINTKEVLQEISKDIYFAARHWIDGDNIFWNVSYKKEKQKVIVKCYEENGKQIDEIEIKDFKGYILDNSFVQVEEMRTDKDYIYLLSNVEKSMPILQIFTKKGDLVRSYESVGSFDVDGKGNCIYISGNEGFFKIDSKSGKVLATNPRDFPDIVRYDPIGEVIYGIEEGRNQRVSIFDGETGELKKQIFTFGKDSSYMLDQYYIRDFLVGDNETLYFCYETNSPDPKDIKIKTYAYKKESGERTEKMDTLTITSPVRNDFMADAISRYELKYPDKKIKYDFTYNSEEEYNEHFEEYRKKLTLDILSGNTADIILTGSRAVSYPTIAKTDAFVDLTPYIEKDPNYSKLNKSVLNGLKINNSIRALPLSYAYYQYEVNDELAKKLGLNLDYGNLSWSEVIKLVKIIEQKAPEAHLFTPHANTNNNTNWEIFSQIILGANMNDLIDVQNKKVNLNQAWFKELIRDFKEYSKSKNFTKPSEPNDQNKKYSIYDWLRGSLFVLRGNAGSSSYRDMMGHFVRYNKDHRSHLVPIFTGEKSNNRMATSSDMYSINNRSTRKEEAWKFLSFMLQDDINSLKSNRYMPINQTAVDIVIENALENEGRQAKKNKDYESFNIGMKDISQKIDYLYDMNDFRKDITVPIQAYMDDKMTLDEAIKKAEENVMIRLNE